MKTLLFITIAFIHIQTCCSQTTLDPYLLAHWKFDSTTEDFSNSGLYLQHVHGIERTVTYLPGRNNIANRALHVNYDNIFNTTYFSQGTGFENRPIQLDSVNNSWSVAAWVTGAGATLISNINRLTFNDSVYKNQGQFTIGMSSKSVRIQLVDTTGEIITFQTDSIYNRLQWNHVVCCFDKDADSLILYVNGIRGYANKLVPIQQEIGITCVGGLYHMDSSVQNGWTSKNIEYIESFNGTIDDLRIYKRKLNATDVTFLYLYDNLTTIEKNFDAGIALKIFPNPVYDVLSIENTDPNQTINVYNLSGRLLTTQRANSGKTQVEFQSMPKGIYTLEVNTVTDNYTQKIIKQ